jgi:hypothetical protein
MALPPSRPSLLLSDMIGRLEVRCELCDRHGLYRADRLMTEIGDVALTEALSAIAAKAGCRRANTPPSAYDLASPRCQIKRVVR